MKKTEPKDPRVEALTLENKKLKELYKKQLILFKQLETKHRILKYDKDILTAKLNSLTRKKE